MHLSRTTRLLLRAGTALTLAFLYLPLLVIALYAFNSRRTLKWPIPGLTFRRVILPLVLPALIAGSIFTFSLTLGDYIAPDLITSQQFIGTVIYDQRGVNLPVAAAYTFVPIVVMTIYLLVARRLKAFQAL